MLGFLWQLFSILFRWRLVQVPPNKAAVITGPKATRILREGSTWVKEPIERFQGYIELNQMEVVLDIEGAYTRLFVPISVRAIGLIKVRGEDEAIKRAAERYLGMPAEQMKTQVQQTLVGHLRSILATMTVEEVNADRQALAERTSREAEADLKTMGIAIDALTIQHVLDEHRHVEEVELGYMDALGRKTIAEAKREALIQTAKAEREAEVYRAQQEAEKAQARRDRDLLINQYAAQVAEAEARAQQAGPRENAKARQEVVLEEVKVEQKRKEGEIVVQEKEIERKTKELEATVVQPAEAEKEATLKRAEAERQARIMKAEADRVEREQAGSGEGRRIREVGEAEAAVAQKKMEAAAAGEKAKLLAEGEGQERLVKALNTYDRTGITISVARELIQRLPQMVEAASRPLAEIDRVVMIDSGVGDGAGAVARFAGIIPLQVARTLELLRETTGIDFKSLLEQQVAQTQEKKKSATP